MSNYSSSVRPKMGVSGGNRSKKTRDMFDVLVCLPECFLENIVDLRLHVFTRFEIHVPTDYKLKINKDNYFTFPETEGLEIGSRMCFRNPTLFILMGEPRARTLSYISYHTHFYSSCPLGLKYSTP